MDKSEIGNTGKPITMQVERGKIREFARATLAEEKSWFEDERSPVPPTFLTTTFFWEEGVAGANPWSLVKMDQRRGMHAEQEYVFFGPPPRAGTRLHCRSRIDEIYEKEGRRGGKLGFAVMITEFRDDSGRLVAEARLVGVETEKPPETGDAG